MKTENVINHPDAHLFETITHDGVDGVLSALRDGDPYRNFIIAVDDTHHKYSKIYILAIADVV